MYNLYPFVVFAVLCLGCTNDTSTSSDITSTTQAGTTTDAARSDRDSQHLGGDHADNAGHSTGAGHIESAGGAKSQHMNDPGGETDTPNGGFRAIDATSGYAENQDAPHTAAGHAAETGGSTEQSAGSSAGQEAMAGANAIDPRCVGVSDNTVIRRETDDRCTYADPCADRGTKQRIETVCVAGVVEERQMSMDVDCQRETEGKVVNTGDYSACMYDDPCVPYGYQMRVVEVCSGGRLLPQEERTADECWRTTENQIVAEGDYSACEYDIPCDVQGERSRIYSICIDGQVTERIQTDTRGCRRGRPDLPMCDRDCPDDAPARNGVCACVRDDYRVKSDSQRLRTVCGLDSPGLYAC